MFISKERNLLNKPYTILEKRYQDCIVGYTAYLHLMTRSRALSPGTDMTIITDLINLPRPSRIRDWGDEVKYRQHYIDIMLKTYRGAGLAKAYWRASPTLAYDVDDVIQTASKVKGLIFWLPGMPKAGTPESIKAINNLTFRLTVYRYW